VPIASLSLGCARDFVFRHRDARKRGPQKREILPGVETLHNILTALFSRLLRVLHCKQNYKIELVTPYKLETLRYLEMTVTKKIYSIEIKSRLNRGECLLPLGLESFGFLTPV